MMSKQKLDPKRMMQARGLRKMFKEGGVVGRQRYAVVENMPGYLPEGEPAIFDAEQDAEDYAKEQQEELREQGLDDVYVVEVIPVWDDESPEDYDAEGIVPMAEGGVLPKPEKGSPEWHRLKIARDTLKMPDEMVGVMGGPNKEEALETLRRYGEKVPMAEGGIVAGDTVSRGDAGEVATVTYVAPNADYAELEYPGGTTFRSRASEWHKVEGAPTPIEQVPCFCGHTEASHTDVIVAGAWLDFCELCESDPEAGIDPYHLFSVLQLAKGGVTMSRQHYQLMAQLIHDFAWNDYSGYEARDAFADWSADALAATNPQFDRSRFVAAATGMAEGGVVEQSYAEEHAEGERLAEEAHRQEVRESDAGDVGEMDLAALQDHMRNFHNMLNPPVNFPDAEKRHEWDHDDPPYEGEVYKNHSHGDLLLDEGAAIVAVGHEPEGLAVEVGDVPAVINEAGPEAVIPLDDPAAVEVMAEAIEEGTGEAPSDDGAEAIAEAAEAVAEAAEEVAEAAEVVAEVAAEEVATAAEVAEVAVAVVGEVAEEAIEDAAEVATETAESATPDPTEPAPQETQTEAPSTEVTRDVAPRSRHWSQRTLAELFGRRN